MLAYMRCPRPQRTWRAACWCWPRYFLSVPAAHCSHVYDVQCDLRQCFHLCAKLCVTESSARNFVMLCVTVSNACLCVLLYVTDRKRYGWCAAELPGCQSGGAAGIPEVPDCGHHERHAVAHRPLPAHPQLQPCRHPVLCHDPHQVCSPFTPLQATLLHSQLTGASTLVLQQIGMCSAAVIIPHGSN